MNSRMQSFESDTLTAVLNSKRVWLIHVITNALLMVAFFYWTRIPEETGWELLLTVIWGLAVGFLTLWLHGSTFVYFSAGSERSFSASLRSSMARIPAFLIWTVIFGIGLWLIGQLWNYDEQAGGYVRHLLPQFLRRAIAPRSIFSSWHWATWFVYFFLWPMVCLPVGAQVAIKNFRGFVSVAALRPVREVRFWLAYLICFLMGAYVPFVLAWMVPREPSSLTAQTWSMIFRLGIGYLLLVTAWVVLCAAIMRASAGDQRADKEVEPAPIRTTPVST
jgi:hypothetical protein